MSIPDPELAPSPVEPDLAPPQAASELAPVSAGERFVALDAVRGFALLGIFLMNVEFFTRPLQDVAAPGIDPGLTGANWWSDAAIFFFVQSKFWTLFSLLFGMGFAMMIERAQRAGRPFTRVYLRRSLALLGIGTVHALLIWSGDILVTYAIGALLLLAMRGVRRVLFDRPLSAGLLAGLGVALYGAMLAAILAGGAAMSSFTPPPDQKAEMEVAQAEALSEFQAVRENAERVYSDGTYAEAVAQRVDDMGLQLNPGNLIFFEVMLLGVFMIGGGIMRAGIAEDPRAHAGKLRLARNVGLPVGLGVMAWSASMGTGMPMGGFGLHEALQMVTFLGAGLILAIAYAATVTLALGGAAGGFLRNWIAPAGRMALTNYLTQSVVGTLVFYNYGLDAWGRIGRFEQVLLVFGVFALQLVLSRWWLARFRFGPAEWLWRALTYWHLPPMRRALPA